MSADRNSAVSIIWPDGCLDSAATWAALFDQVRLNQWHEFTRKEFREEMARRAEIWSGTAIDLSTCRMETVFRRLEDAGMLRIVAGIREESIHVEA